ncbi:ABC transporter ATP-binding protein [Actinopolymorpha singaporensis]
MTTNDNSRTTGATGSTGTSRTSADDGTPFLAVDNLSVRFPTPDGIVNAVTELSYDVHLGRTLGIVGESGSGKSVSSMAIMGLHDRRRARITGSIRLQGTDLVGVDDERMRRIRGNAVSMIFQDPLSSLHPFFSIGDQIAEAYLAHHKASKGQARRRAIEMLDRVGIPQAARRVDDYPHQFSGGMRQRAMIAMALVNDPKLLIADEPTTALDVTVQAQILDLLQDLQKEFGSAIILITHDLGVVAEVADDVLVMYGGRCVEYGTGRQILTRPEHPYTWGLLSSAPHLTGDPDKRLNPIKGMPPSLINLPSGCSFHPRCPYAPRLPDDRCVTTLPELRPGGRVQNHLKACHLPDPDEIFVEEILPRIG